MSSNMFMILLGFFFYSVYMERMVTAFSGSDPMPSAVFCSQHGQATGDNGRAFTKTL